MVSFDICEGNPGCLRFLIEAYKMDPFNAENAFSRMQRIGIRGADLYMLWNDCCGRDTTFAIAAMREAAGEELCAHLPIGIRGVPFSDKEKAAIIERIR